MAAVCGFFKLIDCGYAGGKFAGYFGVVDLIMESSSFYLFAIPGFMDGVAGVFDPADALSTYNESPSGADADAIAAYADWKAVATDFEAVVRREVNSAKETESAITRQ